MKAPEVFGQSLQVPIDDLIPNPWNPNQMDSETRRKERNSIQRFGFVVPVIVRRIGPKNRWQIIDGEQRWREAKELGLTEAPIFNIGPISDHEARQLTVILNELHGRPEPEKLSELLKGLLASDTLDELTEVMPFSKDEYGKLAKLPEFNWDQFKERNREATPRWKEYIFRLPPEAAAVVQKALDMAKAGDEQLKDWQALERVAATYLGE